MSTTTKRTLAEATADAESLRGLFPAEAYERWTFAGSLRRGKPCVGDVEHVILPRFGDKPGAGLFAERVSLLWDRLDALLKDGVVQKHVYGTSGFRWGQINRGVDFRGAMHEFFTTTVETWPSKLTIYTGPAEFSQRLVAGLLRNSRRNIDGCVWTCRKCPHCDRGPECKVCDGTGLEPVEKYPVADEREYFAACGIRWLEPHERM